MHDFQQSHFLRALIGSYYLLPSFYLGPESSDDGQQSHWYFAEVVFYGYTFFSFIQIMSIILGDKSPALVSINEDIHTLSAGSVLDNHQMFAVKFFILSNRT